MTGLDWVLVGALVVAAVGGTTQGFLSASLSFVGFVGGALAGARLGPLVLPNGTDDVNAPVAALFGAVLLGTLVGGVLQQVGYRIRRRLRGSGPGGFRGAVGVVDAALGAAFTAAVVAIAVWLVATVALQTPGVPASWRTEIRHSSVLKELRRTLPPSDDVLSVLARFDPLPGFEGPRLTVDAPDQAIVRDPGARAAREGVVRVEGSACGVGVVGSGWVISEGYVVTNQHVVAGEQDTTVVPESSRERMDAYPVYVNRVEDIAILAVPGLSATPLRTVTEAKRGTSGAILGYPRAQPFRARAARIGAEETVTGQDSYGAGPVRRHVLPFRGLVEQGNSGGPIVDGKGRVLGTVFASSTRAGRSGGYAVPNGVVLDALASIRSTERIDAGPCNH